MGVETEKDEKVLIPGELTSLENGVFDKNITIIKRVGTRALSRARAGTSFSAVSGAIGLASRADEQDLVMLASSDEILSYDIDSDTWVRRGDWVHLSNVLNSLPRGANERWDATTAATPDGTVRVVAWEDARGGVYAQLLNQRNVPFASEFRLGGNLGRQPTAFACGGQLQVIFASASSPATLQCAVINAANPTAASASLTQLYSSLWSVNPTYGAAIVPPGNMLLVAAVASQSLHVMQVNGLGQTVSASDGTYGSGIPPAVAVSADGLKAAVVYQVTASNLAVPPLSGVEAWVFDVATLTTGSSGYRLTMDVNPLTNGNTTLNRLAAGFLTASNGVYTLQALAEVSASDPANRYVRRSVAYTTSSVSFASGTLVRHSTLASPQFTFGAHPFVWVTHASTLQPTDFLVRADDGLTVCRSRANVASPNVSGVLGSMDVRGNQMNRATVQRNRIPLPVATFSASVYQDRDVRLQTVTYQPSSSWKPVDVDGVLHMPGGWPGTYDGAQVTEMGFGLKTEALSASIYGSAGNLAAGNYLWAAVPEWFDAAGRRRLGGTVSFATASFTGSANSGTLYVRTLAHTMMDGTRAPNLRFAIYRTGPNGTLFQRVDDPRSPVLNNTGSDVVVFVDNVSDATRALNEVIYLSDGGGPEAQNTMPPSCTTLCMARDRIFAAGCEGQPYSVYASKLRLGGAVNFTDGGQVSLESLGGPITGLAPLDNSVAAFKRGRVYLFGAPDLPSNLATDTTPWPVPELRTADVGAPAPPVIVEVAGTTAQGLLFKSARGGRLLGREGSVQDVGGPVRGYDGLTAVAGVGPSAHNEARLYTAEGRTLVFNTRFDRWSTFPSQPAVGACNWQGYPVYAWPDGTVWAETTSSYLDGGTPYSMVIELGWLPLADSLQGLSRVRQVYLLGSFYSSHDLVVEAAYDYRDSWFTLADIDTTASLGIVPYGGGTSGSAGAIGYGSGSYGGSDVVYQFRIALPVQRLQTLRLRISDRNATGRSFDLTELKLWVATESSKPRTPTRKRF